jgi:myo-inositol catabolism protein IolC
VLVRYNPGGDAKGNAEQAARLKKLSEFLRGENRHMMFELLVPAEKSQLDSVGGVAKRYDLELRPALMVEAIRQLQDAGVEPDLWKIEGLDRREDCVSVVAAARRDGRDTVGCIILGRGEDEAHVVTWLEIAASVPGFIGFAVGRTSFWDPVVAWKEGKLPREEAAEKVAQRFMEWVDIFEKAAAARK